MTAATRGTRTVTTDEARTARCARRTPVQRSVPPAGGFAGCCQSRRVAAAGDAVRRTLQSPRPRIFAASTLALAVALTGAACTPHAAPSREPLGSRTPLSQPPATRTAAPATPSPEAAGPPAGWTLVFSDDFDGTQLDSSRWSTEFPWGPTSTSTPLAVYRPTNVTVGGGAAIMTARRDPASPSRYTTGMISTGGQAGAPASFVLTQGYVEVRARVPRAGPGLWPAVWLLPTSGDWPPEIDIMEWTGNRPNRVETAYHYRGQGGSHEWDTSEVPVGPSFSEGYHTFAVEWTTKAIRWFVDGRQQGDAFTDTRFISNQPMYLLATLQVGGGTGNDWAGTPNKRTPFPAQFAIDYIRAWKPR